MEKLLYFLVMGVTFISCEKSNPLDDYIEVYETIYTDTIHESTTSIDYNFTMVGRCSQDNNGYYQLTVNPGPDQTLHRFGAYITNTDIYGLPSQVIWSCNTPIVNGTSFADPNVDSVFCMMAPDFSMQHDTVTIYGRAWFEEGDIILRDSINVIFK